MPRYEFSEGSSNKFWEITIDGMSFTTTYGRVGTAGQTTLKEYDSEEKAKREYEKLIAEKVKKGYQLVGGGGGRAANAPKPAAAATKKSVRTVFEDEGDEDDVPPVKKAAPTKSAVVKTPTETSETSKIGNAGTRYFEFIEGTSSKFWEIQIEGKSFATRYGKIGTDGQQSLKEYASEAQARKEYDKLIAEKTKKGYIEK